jgi:novel protein kinase C epsilon type
MIYTGTIKVKVIEATDLQLTNYSVRLGSVFAPKTLQPFVKIDSDEINLDRTSNQQRGQDPVWDEEFTVQIQDASVLTFTIFHDAILPPDVFIADCNISLEHILNASESNEPVDFWVSFFAYILSFSTVNKLILINYNSIS